MSVKLVLSNITY